ncbi:MAG TPA: thiamine pyrophosphate-dependent enzyme [Bryobacteraceae bacterium]|nr:thiamine pyrophosphate-dependent enzyme [Bryobacteraceae bacterium]
MARKGPVGRRGFLKGAAGAAAGAAALATSTPAAKAQAPERAATPLPSTALAAAEKSPPIRGDVSTVDVYTTDRPGADFMVDVIKTLNFDYVCANPGSSFRGLHESLVNYGGNKAPEFITCCHEESSVAMAHGYFKIEGKPLMVMAHGTVGLQHASMAIYNAYADRVPVYIVLGNIQDIKFRRSDVEWAHSVQDAAAMVRDYTKWDDNPVSLGHFAESSVRAYKIAMTPPYEPVVIVADAVLQEEPMPEADRRTARIPKLTLPAPPAGDSGALAEAAKLLVAAENPLIVAGRSARTPQGIALLVELAETLQAPVQDRHFRMNFPSLHPLSGGNIATADVVLGLEVQDFWMATHTQTPINRMGMQSKPITKPGAKLVTIYSGDLYGKSNYQDFGRYAEVDLSIAADAEATLPALIEACRKLITPDRRRAMQARGAKLAEASKAARERDIELAAYGWDASPISTARVSMELWNQIKNEDWSLVSDVNPFFSSWPLRLWDFKKHYQYLGEHGAYGIGYGAPAAVGAALANRKHGRLTVNIQCDGDLNYAPGVLWTAAHHRIPLLTIMHNNRAYHQEAMYLTDMAARANRSVSTFSVGSGINDPNIDYATMAKAYGMYGKGPITDPKDLGPAIKEAIAVVKRGEPALIDVVTQPR